VPEDAAAGPDAEPDASVTSDAGAPSQVLPDAAAPAALRMGVAIPACGGDDAPSVIIRVAAPGGPPLACTLARPTGAQFDEIWPWSSLTVGQIPFSIPGTGAASSCDESGCTDAIAAALTVTAIAPPELQATAMHTVTGTYKMVLTGGMIAASAFVVTVCDTSPGPCGG
jgi:hypothetical protein